MQEEESLSRRMGERKQRHRGGAELRNSSLCEEIQTSRETDMSLSAYLLSPCADGGQVTSHPRAVAFTLSPRLVVIKRKIAVGPEGSPAHIATAALWFPKVTHGESDLPATELGGSQWQTHAGRRQRAGASGARANMSWTPG